MAASEPPPFLRDARGFELGTDGFTVVVVGYDGSEAARDAVAFAAGIARRGPAHLHVCVVFCLPPLTGACLAAAGPIAAGWEEEFGQLRQEVAPQLAQLGIAATFIRRQGDPVRELVALADELRADLLVVGRSRSPAHAVLGSAAVGLAKRAHCPVVVVP